MDMSVIIPAHNEEDYIAACLDALVRQNGAPPQIEVLLSANACTDDTVRVGQGHRAAIEAKGWSFRILETSSAGKPMALNHADAAAQGRVLVYLDADVVCGPQLLQQLFDVLGTNEPLYASGTFEIAPAKTWVSRTYGRFWANLPFVKSAAIGAGLFAVNRSGRARWDAFPAIISDDTFVRLQFEPEERIEVLERYIWPLVEGFGNLVKVRHRQDRGVDEISRLFPDLREREAKAKASLGQLARRDPIGFAVYAAVKFAVKMRGSDGNWTRGR